jgi:hypothetical protein
MNKLHINVTKQIDGYAFSLLPSVREFIKQQIPHAHPANNIFVGYDTKSAFEVYIGKLETHIYPALLGINEDSDLEKLGVIQFIDSQTGKVLYTVKHDEKV